MGIIATTELALFLGIPDNADDYQLTSAVAAANQFVVETCGRSFDKTPLASPTARVFAPDRHHQIPVDDFWETSALVVKVDNDGDGAYETTWTLNTDFYLTPLNGVRYGQTWPYNKIVGLGTLLLPNWWRRPPVQVTAAWGWASVPSAVQTATLIKAAQLFKRKDSVEGVLGGFADFTAIRIGRYEDRDVMNLLKPFRTLDGDGVFVA